MVSAVIKSEPTTLTASTSSQVSPNVAASQDITGADDFRQLFGAPLPPAVAFSAANPPLPYGYPDPPAASAPAVASSAPAASTASPALTVSSDPGFIPSFRNAYVTDGVTAWNLNHDYFATQQTAQWIANKYGTGQVVSTPFEGTGGPYNANASEFQIVLADGRTVNAGILAGYYERNPEAQFPGLADRLIRDQLGLA